ncbi:MAG: NAD+ synthase [Planctomycetes bacterium]|nr:NAD+ synthase [Planctomycetota bacterium]
MAGMKIALLQLNPTIGDFDANVAAIAAAARKAAKAGAELCIAPEIALSGYPPHDMMLTSGFVARNEAARDKLVKLSGELRTGLLFGLVLGSPIKPGKPLSNAAVLCDNGKIVAVKRKALLPTYDVFDERRYFEPDPTPCIAEFRGVKIGLLICEDIWTDASLLGEVEYASDPAVECSRKGAQLLVNLTASPWGVDKHWLREKLVAATARRTGLTTLLVAQVGANDDLIFDGGSVVCDGKGKTVMRMPLFKEDMHIFDTAVSSKVLPWLADSVQDQIDALTLGIADYFRKTGHRKALIGLSGGIDSALTACLAARALGPANVHGITMPTRYSSEGSVEDSRKLAGALGIGFEVVNIDAGFETLRGVCGKPGGLAEENLQARLRGIVLMTRANARGELLLATGNRSELAVGYSTLYGDMCGALEVIGDLPKTRVYELARRFAEIPPDTHTKAPSAELRPNQTDQDSLPPYDVLDRVLAAYIDERLDIAEIVKRGIEPDLAARVARMVEIAEFKRRQAPIVLRVSGHAFGAGRRMPVAKKT